MVPGPQTSCDEGNDDGDDGNSRGDKVGKGRAPERWENRVFCDQFRCVQKSERSTRRFLSLKCFISERAIGVGDKKRRKGLFKRGCIKAYRKGKVADSRWADSIADV